MKYQSLFEDLKFLLFSFKGRITRSEWWIYVLLRSGVFLIPVAILLIRNGRVDIPHVYGLTNFLQFYVFIQDNLMLLSDGKLYVSLLLTFLLVYFDAATFIKRLHDINLSNWFVLLGFVPIYAPLGVLVICGFIRGTQGVNRYGESPYRDISENESTQQPQVEG